MGRLGALSTGEDEKIHNFLKKARSASGSKGGPESGYSTF
jgi:hypothetical protein